MTKTGADFTCRALHQPHHWTDASEPPAAGDDVRYLIDEYHRHRHGQIHPIVDLGIVR